MYGIKKSARIISYLIVLIVCPMTIHAGLFEQLAVSTMASSMGNAVTAYPPGALAVHYNPAGLSTIQGTRFDNGLVFTVSKREVKVTQAIDPLTGELWAPFGGWFNEGKDPLDGQTGELQSGYMVIPIIDYEIPYLAGAAMGISHKPPEKNSRVTFGFGQYAPFAAGLKHHSGDLNSFLGRKAFFLRFVLAAPAIAYQLTDTLSVGISVPLGVTLFSFQTNMRTPNTMVALTGALGEATEDLEIPLISELTFPPPWFNGGMTPYEKAGELDVFVEDYFTTSYNLGLLWEPTRWFAFGLCYQSESETTMEGEYKFTYGHEFKRTVDWLGRSPLTIIISGIFDLPNESVPYQKGRATVSMVWPARLQLGIMLRPVKQIIFTCDAHWTEWSSWPKLQIDCDQKIQLFQFAKMLGYQYGPKTMVVNFDFKDTWHLSYGLEIRPIDKIALRLGYEPRPTSNRDDRFGPMPLADIDIYSVGLRIVEEKYPKRKPKNLHELNQQLLKPSTVELSFSYVKIKDKLVKSNTSTNLNSTDFTDIVYNPYAGLDWEQEYSIMVFSLNQVFKW